MTGFWIFVVLAVLAIIGVSVLVGLNLKDSREHKASRAEMMALKSSGAFKERKSSMNGE